MDLRNRNSIDHAHKGRSLCLSKRLVILFVLALAGVWLISFNYTSYLYFSVDKYSNANHISSLMLGNFDQSQNANTGAADKTIDSSKASGSTVQHHVGKLNNSQNTDTSIDDKDIGSSKASESTVQYHVIFSTGCSIRQDWQSYMFFFHAMKSGQLGDVTRIASGCKEEESEELMKQHKEQIQIMSPKFHLHLTPEYSKILPGVNFQYFNKPFGVQHWMENALGYSSNKQKQKEHDDSIIILCDPDQIILRPFTNDFTDSIEEWRPRKSRQYGMKVDHGYPFAQQYGFHAQWKDSTNISAFVKPDEAPSPVESMPRIEVIENYAAGPPYMATARDMYQIATKWAEFAPSVYQQYPFLLAEMFAYSLAAAHLQLPHQLSHSLMLSDTSGMAEAWQIMVDKFSDLQVCGEIPKDHLPHVLHYCQSYNLGKWFFKKHRLPPDFLSCETPLLATPPKDVATLYNFSIKPSDLSRKELEKKIVKRHAFVLCYLLPALNDGATFYKQHQCSSNIANYEETKVFFDSMEI